MDENGIRKGDRSRDATLKLSVVVQAVPLTSTWLYFRFYGIFVALVIILCCLVFSARGKMLRKAIDVDYNFTAPEISFVYFIMLMNIITRDF